MYNIFRNFKQKLHFVFTFSVIAVLVKNGNSEMFKEHCNEENNSTCICNYVTKFVPEQYINVRIVDFKRKDKGVILKSSSFADESWLKVQTLEFYDTTGRDLSCIFLHESFRGLTALKELRIHMSSFWWDPGVFVGLPSVHTLDLSKCYRLFAEDLAEQLKVPNTLPRLKKLYLSEMGSYDIRNNINLKFVQALSPRNVTFVDISRNQIKFLNLTALLKHLKTLEYVNVSYSRIADTWITDDITKEDLSHLKAVDLSHLTLPTKIIRIFPGHLVVANMTTKYSEVRKLGIEKWIHPLAINASGLVPDMTSEWIYNVTIILDEQIHSKVQKLVIRQNNIRYLDAVVRCPIFKFTSLIHLDLSDNGLQMFRPTSCVPNLETFVLSKNELFRTLEEKTYLFGELFAAHTKLRVINLSKNHLPKVPPKLFKNNKNVEIVDLSFNKLEQLHLDLVKLYRLRIFDVSHNNIQILDGVSINSLRGISRAKSLMSREYRFSVILTSNPIRCSTCVSKPFIEWLVYSKAVNAKAQDLTCTTEDGTNINIDKSALRKVQNICNRRIIIIVSTVPTGVTLLIIAMAFAFLYRRKLKVQKKQNRVKIINKLNEGEGQYEFVAFLAYSNRDDQFVQEHVIDQLNENLQLMTGIDRNLVCTGDRHLRPGFMVHDETTKCLDRASVIIIVVSNNFCRSVYCQNEFDQACIQRKPIVLMCAEHVEEDLMMPTMRQLYKREVRILWTAENGQYVLKTTWENVCRSVLDKVPV